MKFIVVLVLFIQGGNLYAQSDLRNVSVSDLPEDIQNIKNISRVVRWTDSLGDNVMVITKKIVKREDEDRIVDKKYKNNYNYNRIGNRGDNFPKQTIPPFAYHFEIVND